jgi:SAM-dependent methyltransferase
MKLWLRSAYRRYQHAILPGRYDIRRFIRAHATGVTAAFCADVGAGTNPFRAELEESFGVQRYVSIDIAPSDLTAVCADCRQLPFRDSSIDLVVGFDVIMCVPDSQRMLSEAARIIAPQGHLLLTYTFIAGESGIHDYRRWTLEGLQQELIALGFQIVDQRRRGGLFFALIMLIVVLILKIVPGGRTSWRAGLSNTALARMTLISLLLLPFHIIGWIALLIDRCLPPSPIYFGGIVLAQRGKH